MILQGIVLDVREETFPTKAGPRTVVLVSIQDTEPLGRLLNSVDWQPPVGPDAEREARALAMGTAVKVAIKDCRTAFGGRLRVFGPLLKVK